MDSENKKYWKHAYIEKLPENLDYRISKRAYTFFTDHYPKENIMKVQDSLRKAEEFLNQIFVGYLFLPADGIFITDNQPYRGRENPPKRGKPKDDQVRYFFPRCGSVDIR